LDVATSRDECTCTRLNWVVSTRKRPFTEEYQLLAHDRWFSPGTPASSITKTGRQQKEKKFTFIFIFFKNKLLKYIIIRLYNLKSDTDIAHIEPL
jgi:hypothetical protein